MGDWVEIKTRKADSVWNGKCGAIACIDKQRRKVASLHLRISRQRKDHAVKTARALVQSHDLVVYEDLKVSNMVKNHKLAKSISDASWYQFTQWVDYFAKIHKIVCVSVAPHFTTQDCSVCKTRVTKSLSTRTHQCPKCKTVLDEETFQIGDIVMIECSKDAEVELRLYNGFWGVSKLKSLFLPYKILLLP